MDWSNVYLGTLYQYERIEESRQVDEERGIVTINSVGRCVSSDGTFWHYAGPIIGFHILLVVGTNLLLYQVRDIADRYQEQKYVAIASALMLEILLVGIPVLVSVRNNVSATFIVLTAIVALDDIAVLCCIFGPKVMFQRKGLEQGVHFGESILRDTHRRASLREFSRREMSSSGIFESRAASNSDEKSKEFEVDDLQKNSKTPSTTSSGGNDDSSKGNLVRRRENGNKGGHDRGGALPPNSRFTNSSVLEGSIAEETSADLQHELSSDEHSVNSGGKNTRNSSREQNPKRFEGLNRSGVYGGISAQTLWAGISASDSGLKPRLDSSSSSSLNDPIGYPRQNSGGDHSTLSSHTLTYDSATAIEEQARMMDITKKMMEDHERMMVATAEVFEEHRRLKEQLESEERVLTSNQQDATHRDDTTRIAEGSPAASNENLAKVGTESTQ
jgi:hypothetical protein